MLHPGLALYPPLTRYPKIDHFCTIMPECRYLGQRGLRLKWAKGRFWSRIDENMKVLRMSLPTVGNLSGLQESIFGLFRGPQLKSRKKSKNGRSVLNSSHYPVSPRWANSCLGSLGLLLLTLFGVLCWIHWIAERVCDCRLLPASAEWSGVSRAQY